MDEENEIEKDKLKKEIKNLEEELQKNKEWNSTTHNSMEDVKTRLKDEVKRLANELDDAKKSKLESEKTN